MSAYGRALLLLLLDETKDARGNELAAALIGEAQTRGDVSWWAVANDPLIFDYAETSVEATAFAVQALVRRDPTNPVVERAVRWMMLNRTAGYWSSTKQTAIAIYGLLAFMQARGETAQPFSVDVFVNGQPAGRHSFTAASMTASGSDRHLGARERRRQPGAAREARRCALAVGGLRPSGAVLVRRRGVLRHRHRRCAQRDRASSR